MHYAIREVKLPEIEIGDRIKFKSATRNSNNAVWRKVNGFWPNTSMPTVRFEGWSNFAVRLGEVLEVEKESKTELIDTFEIKRPLSEMYKGVCSESLLKSLG